MCILLKLHYAKFDLSNLFCSKVIEEKPLGGRLDSPPPLVKEGLMQDITFTTAEINSSSLDSGAKRAKESTCASWKDHEDGCMVMMSICW